MDCNASSGRRVFTPEFRLKVVLESMQHFKTRELMSESLDHIIQMSLAELSFPVRTGITLTP